MPPQGRPCRLPSLCAPPPRNLRSDTTYCSSGGGDLRGRRGRGRGLLAEVQKEQRLVDAALEDRHAQLHALLNHLAALQACFAGQLRGREVDCHFCCPPSEVCALTWKVSRAHDGLNGDLSRPAKHSPTRESLSVRFQMTRHGRPFNLTLRF